MFTLEYLSGLGQPAAPVHLAPGLHELLDEGRVGHIASVNAAQIVLPEALAYATRRRSSITNAPQPCRWMVWGW
jgi:hypothetical protein